MAGRGAGRRTMKSLQRCRVTNGREMEGNEEKKKGKIYCLKSGFV